MKILRIIIPAFKSPRFLPALVRNCLSLASFLSRAVKAVYTWCNSPTEVVRSAIYFTVAKSAWSAPKTSRYGVKSIFITALQISPVKTTSPSITFRNPASYIKDGLTSTFNTPHFLYFFNKYTY
jgi:hypothetical protein